MGLSAVEAAERADRSGTAGSGEPPLLALLGPRPVLAGVAGACCIAFSAVLVRLAGVEPATAAVFRCLYALPLLGLLMLLEDRRLGPRPRRARLLAAGAGVFFAFDLVIWHHAIAAVGAGLGTVLGNLQVVVVGLAAWVVLGERLSRRLLLAIPVVLAGVVLVGGVLDFGSLGGRPYGAHPTLGVVLGIITSLAYAGFLLVLRQGRATCAARPVRSSTPPRWQSWWRPRWGSSAVESTWSRPGPHTVGCCCWR
ncbi:MAG: hypothetical protein NVSMB13_20690 [Mycobacteriales bacterium]